MAQEKHRIIRNSKAWELLKSKYPELFDLNDIDLEEAIRRGYPPGAFEALRFYAALNEIERMLNA